MSYKNKDKRRIYNAKYRRSHKTKIAEYNTKYSQAHKIERKAYIQAHKSEINEYDRARKAEHYRTHKAENAAYQAKVYLELKVSAFDAYGGPKCVCCGETLFEGLTIDHINGDGAEHRKSDRNAGNLYFWLKKNKYPSGFQVLCATCNQAKGTGDHCPHRDLKGENNGQAE